ncbi:TolC family protein [Achromobacter insuavis]|uniref:TolC family protein n=1 Tax=Achromobacter insuavis TaxID=1287735 RepID=UPI000E306621|nr:TolC family protein [Achromobacter insuavis]
MPSLPALSGIRFITLLAIATQLGCTPVTVPRTPMQIPSAWSEPQDQTGRPVDLRSWWNTLDDSRLNALVDEALHRNLDLARSAQLLEAERRLAGRAQAQFLPWLSGGARPAKDAAARDSYFNVGLDMTWELGLFGAAESERRLAQAELEQAEARQQGLRVSLVAAVVRNYLDLGVANGQIAILQRIQAIDSQAERLSLTRLNTHLGSQNEVDATSLKKWQTQAEIASMRLTADRAARALALLLGRDGPDPVWRQVTQPRALTSLALQAVPADLLRTRPDIGQAEAEVLRAAANLGMARAAMYPRLSLGGSILYSYNVTQNRRSNSNFVPSVGPTIDIPLWDWGARRAQVAASTHEIDAALLGYRKAVLTAVSEVEEALSALERLRDRVQALEEAGHVQSRRAAAQRRLAALGLSSDFEAQIESRALLEAQARTELAQGSRTLAFVALYKALGGAPLNERREANP